METGEIVLDELTKQARDQGYLVVALSPLDRKLLLMYITGIVVGWWIARST